MATALSDLVTQVGQRLGITIDSDSIPNTTEVTQWLKDAQRVLLKRLPEELLGSRLYTESLTLSAPYTSVTPQYQVVKLKAAIFTDDSSSESTECVVLPHSKFKVKENIAETPYIDEYYVAFNPYYDRVDIYPTGALDDSLTITYIRDINSADTYYELNPATEPVVVTRAALIAAYQINDYMGMIEKLTVQFRDELKSLGGMV